MYETATDELEREKNVLQNTNFGEIFEQVSSSVRGRKRALETNLQANKETSVLKIALNT